MPDQLAATPNHSRQHLLRRSCTAALVVILLLLGTSPLLAEPKSQRTLNADGPWLIYTATDGLIIANPDGSARTVIAPPSSITRTYYAASTPTGDRLLLSVQQIRQRSGQIVEANGSIRLVSLPGGGTRVLRQELLPTDATQRLDAASLLDMLDDLQNPAWAPGGDRLAYAGSHDGQPDLYLHSLTGGISQQLTDTPAIPRMPVWSPNGRRLLWQEEDGASRLVMMATFASASGHTTDQPPIPLAIELPYRHDWQFVGWFTPDQIIFSATSFDDPDRAVGLYRYDLQNHTQTTLLPEDIVLLPPAYEPSSRLLLVAVTGSGGALSPGIYLVDPQSGTPTLIDNTVSDLAAMAAGPNPATFLLTTGSYNELLQLGSEPGAITLPAGTLYPALTGFALAISDSANHLSLLTEVRAAPATVWQGENNPPVWSVDGQTIYSIIEADGDTTHRLVSIPLRTGQPRTLDEQAVPGVLLLVQPQEVAAFADANIVMYNHANETSGILVTLRGDEAITRVRGRNRTGSWLSLDLDGIQSGWVPATQVTYSGSIDRLVILEN